MIRVRKQLIKLERGSRAEDSVREGRERVANNPSIRALCLNAVTL